MDDFRADPCARMELGLMLPRTLPRGDSRRDMLPRSRAGTPVSRKFILVEKLVLVEFCRQNTTDSETLDSIVQIFGVP